MRGVNGAAAVDLVGISDDRLVGRGLMLTRDSAAPSAVRDRSFSSGLGKALVRDRGPGRSCRPWRPLMGIAIVNAFGRAGRCRRRTVSHDSSRKASVQAAAAVAALVWAQRRRLGGRTAPTPVWKPRISAPQERPGRRRRPPAAGCFPASSSGQAGAPPAAACSRGSACPALPEPSSAAGWHVRAVGRTEVSMLPSRELWARPARLPAGGSCEHLARWRTVESFSLGRRASSAAPTRPATAG